MSQSLSQRFFSQLIAYSMSNVVSIKYESKYEGGRAYTGRPVPTGLNDVPH